MIIMNTLGWSLIGKGPYANRTEWDNETFSIYVTDLGSIWSEHQTILDIAVRCQDLNPLMESNNVDTLIRQIQSILTNFSEDTFQIDKKHEEKQLYLKLTSTLDDFPFSWEFNLSLEPADQFRVLVTFPLLALLKEASFIEQELCTIIRNKDKQIDDYKASGAAVSRRNLETLGFDEKKFFDNRLAKTIEESAKEDVSVLFCQVVDKFKKPYTEVVEQMKRKRTPLPLKSTASHSGDGASANSKPENEIIKQAQQQTESEERSRLEKITERLREEEQNMKVKMASKKKLRIL